MSALLGIGIGALGIDAPLPGTADRHDHSRRVDLCGAFGHPAVTFNPWHNESWCQCGRARSAGNSIEWPKPTDCGGYLADCMTHPRHRSETSAVSDRAAGREESTE